MDPTDVARLVESNEARAYASFMRAAPADVCERLGLRAVEIGSAVAVVAASVTNTVNMNRVIGLGIAEPATEPMLDEIDALYTGCGVSFGIEVGPFTRPPELSAWLVKRRVRRAFPTAVHYRAAARVPTPEEAPAVVRARPADAHVVADICCAVFRMPQAAHALIAGTATAPGWRQWLVYADDRPVAAALSFVQDGRAWLGWDATLAEFRGRGAHAALIARRVNDAVDAGCRWVTTETATGTPERRDASYRNYERLGFRVAYERSTYVAVRAGSR